jgi:hypothetical protein
MNSVISKFPIIPVPYLSISLPQSLDLPPSPSQITPPQILSSSQEYQSKKTRSTQSLLPVISSATSTNKCGLVVQKREREREKGGNKGGKNIYGRVNNNNSHYVCNYYTGKKYTNYYSSNNKSSSYSSLFPSLKEAAENPTANASKASSFEPAMSSSKTFSQTSSFSSCSIPPSPLTSQSTTYLQSSDGRMCSSPSATSNNSSCFSFPSSSHLSSSAESFFRLQLYVGNLPLEITEKEFLDAFSSYGVTDVEIKRDALTGVWLFFLLLVTEINIMSKSK